MSRILAIVGFAIVLVLAGLVLAGMSFGSLLLRGAWQVGPLLPKDAGASVCFAGTFTGRSVDIDDLSRSELVATARLSPDGKPFMRRVTHREKDVSVARFILRLDYDSRAADYDWIYNFHLGGSFATLGEMKAAGECPWYEKTTSALGRRLGLSPTRNVLYCGIDCDGGLMEVARVPGSRSIEVTFDPRTGLRMKRGCDGGKHRVWGNATGASFRLDPAPASVCASLDRED